MSNHCDQRNNAGFTLVELAISTLIIGVLIAAISFPFSVWQKKKKFERTVDNVEQMAWAVSSYRVANGHYPCPAAMNLSRVDPNYGRITDCTDTTTVTTGNCSAEYCVADSPRVIENVNSDGDAILETVVDGSLTAGQDDEFTTQVRIGVLPFRDLNIPEEFAYDSYGNRLLYAVTETLAFSQIGGVQNFENDPSAGGINIVYDDAATGTRVNRLDVPHSANFVVLSHGTDGVGGININGVSNGLSCATASPDSENCDHLAAIGGAGVDNEFYISEIAEGGGTNQHDDLALYQIPLNAPLWARSAANPANIYSLPTEKNPTGKVGGDYLYNFYEQTSKALNPVEHNKVYKNARLWVGGNILVSDPTGQTQSNVICDKDGENCFPASAIGGDALSGVKDQGTKCKNASDRLLRGVMREDNGGGTATPSDISDDQIIGDCDSAVTQSCPPGELMKGIDLATGQVICV